MHDYDDFQAIRCFRRGLGASLTFARPLEAPCRHPRAPSHFRDVSIVDCPPCLPYSCALPNSCVGTRGVYCMHLGRDANLSSPDTPGCDPLMSRSCNIRARPPLPRLNRSPHLCLSTARKQSSQLASAVVETAACIAPIHWLSLHHVFKPLL